MDNIEKDFLNQDKYISESEYKHFCIENNLFPDNTNLKDRNDEFIDKKLVEYKAYFDNMFGADTNINLDEEQRRIILKDDELCLINAGAGTGKSTTMAAKVKYLVDVLHVNPKEIIMLSFTKKSSEDLDEKVNEVLNLGIPVSTFHSLGYQYIRLAKPGPIKVAAEQEKKDIIKKYIESMFYNKQKFLRLLELFKVTKDNKNGFFDGFVQNAPKYNNFDEYFLDYKKRKYERELRNGGIEKYVGNRLRSRTNLNSINGEICKSIGEANIANFLAVYNVEYEYERVFEERVDENKSYTPDFTIEYAGKKIYIEFFGMSECIENNRLIKKRVDKYNRLRRKKEQYQRLHPEYDFINLDYIKPNWSYINTLKAELIKRGVFLNRMSNDEIFDRIISNNPGAEFYKFTDLVINFISTLKNMLVDDVDYIFEKRIKQIKSEKFENKYYSLDNDEEANCRIEALEFLKEIYYFYQNELISNNLVDYDDMINDSYKYIIKNLKSSNKDLRYKYVIVDEYQDITFQRFLFVKRLIEYFNPKLIAVGDDWQSIYSFTGSRLELFNKFSELYQQQVDELFLSTTYRFGQELVEISSEFLTVNKEQSNKNLIAIKNLEHPIKIVEYLDEEKDEEEKDLDPEGEAIFNIVENLYNENRDMMILILARTNKSLDELRRSKFFAKGLGDVLICKKYPDANIEAITMHRSKGLSADQVIIFGLRDSVFPSKGFKDSWLDEYFKLDSFEDVVNIDGNEYHFIKEKFPHAEERRLFYVALTRTKNKVYLVVPKNAWQTSRFVSELKNLL